LSSKRLITLIVASLVLGIVLGLTVHAWAAPAAVVRFADVMELLPFAFLRLIKMIIAPLAVLGSLAATVAKEGLAVLGMYGLFILEFYIGLVILWGVLATLGALLIGKRIFNLLKRIREPVLLAFSTASSEAAYPRTLEELERFGCSNRVASFVLPVGYSFNLDGSMLYCSFAIMFIAQVYGIDLSLGQQAQMIAVLMLTSKGIAGVPRASLVVVAATLAQFNLPEAGLLLLLGADHFLDMGRSATNVVGNSIAAALVSKWEGELAPELPLGGAARTQSAQGHFPT
jgi:Na+/H+-dicarboxylate symporter